MRVKVIIKEGCHSPSLFYKLLYFRFWLFILPKRIEISNVSIRTIIPIPYLNNYVQYVIEDLDSAESQKFITSNIYPYTREQVNKIGGIAYGLPKYSKKYKSYIHPNSRRLGFNLLGKYFRYNYTNGIRDYIEWSNSLEIDTTILKSGSLFAYSLLPFFGGVYKAPCDIIIEYDIKWKR